MGTPLHSEVATVTGQRGLGAANASDLKYQNQRTLLKLLHQHNHMSRADLARQTGLTPSTITTLTTDLIDAGIVREQGRGVLVSAGRRPTLLELIPDARFALGAYIGDLSCFGVITNLRGRVVETFQIETPREQNPTLGLERVIAEARAMIKRWNGPHDRLLGVGLGIPGLVDAVSGTVLFAPNLGWENMPVRTMWQDALGLPVVIENDVRALALGEQWVGLGRQVRSLACVHFGAGVGCGVVVDGKIYRGATGGASEIGHTVIDVNGPLCRCGNHGCLETFAGGQAVIATAARGLLSSTPSSLRDLTGNDPRKLSLSLIFQTARQGDGFAQSVIEQAIKHVSMAVANVINSFDPEMVILSGELIDEGADFIVDAIIETARAHVFGAAARQTPIIVTSLAKTISALGPAYLVFQQQFADLYGPSVPPH